MGEIADKYCPDCGSKVKKNGSNRGKQRYYCVFCKKTIQPLKFAYGNLQIFCDCGNQAKKNGANRGKQRYYCTFCQKDVPYKTRNHLTEIEKEILDSWVRNGKNYSATMTQHKISRYKLKKLIETHETDLANIDKNIKEELNNRDEALFTLWYTNHDISEESLEKKFGVTRKEMRAILANKLNAPKNWYYLYRQRFKRPPTRKFRKERGK